MGSCSTKLTLTEDIAVMVANDPKGVLSLNLYYDAYDKASQKKIDNMTATLANSKN